MRYLCYCFPLSSLLLYLSLEYMIRFQHVFKRYPGGYDALKNVSFELRSGEMAFLTGHSGRASRRCCG